MTGSDKLWDRMRPLSSPETTILTPQEWKFDAAAMANWLHRHLPQKDHTILVAAYSWGGGWGFPQLAKECDKRGLRIRMAVLCDPVYRSPYFIGKWKSMVNRNDWYSVGGILAPKIKVPASVDEVAWFYQRQNKPQAHKLVAINPWTPVTIGEAPNRGTLIHPGVEITGVNHAYMDDADIFHDKVMREFTQILSETS